MRIMKRYASCGVFLVLLGCGSEASPIASEEGSREVTGAVSQAQVAPDDDVSRFPPWILPYIRFSAIFSRYLQGELDVKVAQKAMRAAADACACAMSATAKSNEAVLQHVDTIFEAQYVSALHAKRAFGKGAAFDEDMPCGTVPIIRWPPPPPPPFFEFEREVLLKAIASTVKVDGLDLVKLGDRMDQHAKRIDAVLQ